MEALRDRVVDAQAQPQVQPQPQPVADAAEAIERPIVEDVMDIDNALEPVADIIDEPARVAGNVNITIELTGAINFKEDVRYDAATGNPFTGVISEFIGIPRLTENIQRHEHLIIDEPCISVQYLKFDNVRNVWEKFK